MDIRISPGGSFKHMFPNAWNAFAYIYDGEGIIGDQTVVQQHAIVMDDGDYVQATASDKVRQIHEYFMLMHRTLP